jgi:hypothetical protein
VSKRYSSAPTAGRTRNCHESCGLRLLRAGGSLDVLVAPLALPYTSVWFVCLSATPGPSSSGRTLPRRSARPYGGRTPRLVLINGLDTHHILVCQIDAADEFV